MSLKISNVLSSFVLNPYSGKLLNFDGPSTVECLIGHIAHLAEFELNAGLNSSSTYSTCSPEWRLLSRKWVIPPGVSPLPDGNISLRIIQWNVLAQGIFIDHYQSYSLPI